jgi:hypothetical protein
MNGAFFGGEDEEDEEEVGPTGPDLEESLSTPASEWEMP